ncbi:MAG TPA: histidine kinase [Longimicrobiaceae bacterium]|nr:histidine kinase [Longimicrobiaceae bacterium]
MSIPQRLRSLPWSEVAAFAALLATAVLVDLLLVIVHVHLPPGELKQMLAPAFPASYKNWVMWAAFLPAVVWAARSVTASGWAWWRRVGTSVGLALVLAGAHSAIEMWLHRAEGAHHVLSSGFFSYHVVHGLLTYSIVFAVALLMESDRAARARERREAQLHEQVAHAQLQTLRMQLQPHFLFNTLNSISALVEEDVREGQRMIGQLSDFLRLTLTSTEHQEVPLREELRLVDTYVEIQRARFRDRLAVEYDVDEEAMDALVPNLILQPLVENAIKHGIQPSLAGGTVVVRGYREEEHLVLEVVDDGVGMGTAAEPGTGVGLRNTRERLRRCYGAGAELEIVRRAPTGTVVVQRLPWTTAPAAAGGRA